MENRDTIRSAQNPKIKQACRLKERGERDETGLFLIEGFREVQRAAAGNVELVALFVCYEFFLGVNEPALIEQIHAKGCEIFVCAPYIFEKLSYRDRPDGLVAVARQMRHGIPDLAKEVSRSKNPFLLVAEAIEKPGNLGSMLRSADAVAVDGVIVCDRCTDIYNPNVVRASVGTLFTQPVIEAKGHETLLWLKEQKIKIVSATPHAEKEFTQVDLSGPVAIVVGTEQLGLTEGWMNACDLQVRMPMLGVADSLNVATAATLLLYEVLRQRRR
ncbi:MAG: RNA methyltransferase [Chlamydiales bacterium]|nr:RNA methyltransferase [Chlamydiales bacterium]